MLKNYANLLPEEYRRRRLVRRRLIQWTLVWSAVLMAALPLWGWQSHHLSLKQEQLRQRHEVYAPTNKMIRDIPRMRSEMRELSQRDDMVRKLGDDCPPLAALGMVSQAAANSGGKVRIFQLIVDRPPTQSGHLETKEAQQTSIDKPSLLTLQGTGVDNQSVARFVVNLRQTRAFHRVDLKSSVRGRLALSDVQRFVVECEF
jgi:hypothetical protein